jgi:hypothetical protein
VFDVLLTRQEAKAEDEDPTDVMVVRADVGFLSREGLLMRNLELEAEKADI